MLTQDSNREHRRAGPRRIGVAAGLVVACFIALAGEAYAQTPDGPSAVDQYVEDVPTSKGSAVPGKDRTNQNTLSPSLSNEIAKDGGSDAPLLREIASSSDYGAPKKKTKKQIAAAKRDMRDESGAGPEDPSAGEALSAAASAVQGGDAARLVGLLVALFVISIAALTAAGLRQRRRTG